MTGNEIRKKFIQYFADRQHTVVESSPLIPHNDQTLLFTNAGMVQFKQLFTGEEKGDYVRAVTAQRCVRAGGKHNDLENVGYTARHHTFFEMLGNFSFGDYFKKEAIEYGWDFLTNVIGLPKDKLWVSVFKKDDEAYAIWQQITGLPKDHIIRLGEKDNFWAMGDTGPCGPCSEILIDQGVELSCKRPDCAAGCDCDRYLELWNLVFMQYYRDESGKLTSLPTPSIDTGLGLERIAAVIQGKQNNYDSDLFSFIIDKICTIAQTSYGRNKKIDTALRVIADHSRAATFLVADGLLPSNEGRGYLLRRLIRRAIRYGHTLGLVKPFLSKVTETVIKQMEQPYPHLSTARQLLAKILINEEQRFSETLDHGLAMLHDEIKQVKKSGNNKISGDFIFKLYDTYGFPVDIVKDIAKEEGVAADEAGFTTAMEAQRQQSKKSWKGDDYQKNRDALNQLRTTTAQTIFVGYNTQTHNSMIKGMLTDSGELRGSAVSGEQVSIICTETPFYAEAGGQSGDQGKITGAAGTAEVLNTEGTAQGLIIHQVKIIKGKMTTGETVTLEVNRERRQNINNNHTATHLLHAALKKMFGEHIKQSGSLVDADKLRFDFTHFSPLSLTERTLLEQNINNEIRANTSLHTELLNQQQAIKSGATALFGEKYDEMVRVVSIGKQSKELCGGTHVKATGAIALFKISSESGIAAGVRRIEAVTGVTAFSKFQTLENRLSLISDLLKTTDDDAAAKLSHILSRQKELEKEISRLTTHMAVANLDQMIRQAKTVDGIKVISLKISVDSPKTMREVGDKIRDKLGSGIVVLGGIFADKVSLLAIVSKDLTKRFHAGKIIKEVALTVGGKGGGRPDMAQAGGTMIDKLPDALNTVWAIMHKQNN